MGWLLDEPSVALVCFVAAAALYLVEVALPTVGLAGTAATAAGALGVVVVADEQLDWWPLVGPVLALAIWAVMVARRTRTTTGQALAGVTFGAGAVLFGVLAEDVASVAVGLVGAGLLSALFPRLHDSSTKLMSAPARTGMESMVGSSATVVAWNDHDGTDGPAGTGTVRSGGSLWNATGPVQLHPGDTVEITGHSGMTIQVSAPVAH